MKKKITAWQKRKGLSNYGATSYLSREMGIPIAERTFCSWKSGKNEPHGVTLNRLLEILET